MKSPIVLALASLSVCVVGCGDGEAPRVEAACVPDAAGARLTDADVSARGPFGTGTLTLTLVDDTRTTPAHGGVDQLPTRTLETLVWYPATESGEDMPLAQGGPFPLVAYSHGFSSFNSEGDYLASYLASHGYIVFAPRFPLSNIATPGGPTVIDIADQPRDVSFVIDSALSMGTAPGGRLEGGVDATRIAAVGLSFGGLTSLLVTFHPTLHDPRIRVVVALAPPADILGELFYDTREVPLLLLSGDIDAIVPYEENARVALARANPPVSLLTLADGTHTGFTGVSMAFEGFDNADEVGCSALGGGGGGGPVFDIVAALGGPEAGIVPGLPGIECPDPLPYGMRPSRQLEIARVAVRSFLASYFDPDAVTRGRECDYNENVLPRADDITFERR
jgi:predicted dienelactone hydrolase